MDTAVQHGTIQFIAFGGPPDKDGSADLKYMLAAARNIGRLMTDCKVVVDKSTVPVGAGDLVKAAIAEELKKNRGVQTPNSVVSNPAFLEEGAAVEALGGLRAGCLLAAEQLRADHATSLLEAHRPLAKPCFNSFCGLRQPQT